MCVDLFLVGIEPYRELVQLISMVALLLFVTTFPTCSAGRNLTYRFNPVGVVISFFYA